LSLEAEAILSARSIIAGEGIDLGAGITSLPSVDRPGNALVWRKVRDVVSPTGVRHVFYRQYLRSGSGISEAEIFGAELGLHFSKTGQLRSLSGGQFVAVPVTNRPTFPVGQAQRRALEQLALRGPFRPRVLAALTPKERAHRDARTELKIIGDKAGLFRYAYSTFANEENGHYYNVLIDAATAEIIATADVNPALNCHPSPYSSTTATGHPIRQDLVDAGVRRPLQANVTGDRPFPFTHEGFFQALPKKSVVQETADPNFMCDSAAQRSYSLFPLRLENGIPAYRNWVDTPEWQGNVAGDALYHTDRSMVALNALGRNSFDGLGGDPNIAVQSTFSGIGQADPADNAWFINDSGGDARLPPGRSVAVNRAGNIMNLAAALDIVGHEWGHGVIYTSANFDRNPVGEQLHEGFADVIGQSIEKLIHPAGAGLEQSSDWNIGEDLNANYARSGSIDDGTAGHLFGPLARLNNKMHRDDQPNEGSVHDRGNMLNVVFMLLADGGPNPVCTRLTLSGCGTNVPGLGLTKARQILFDTVSYYAPANAQWENLAERASEAAFDLYSDCQAVTPYHATAEQNSVNRAFTAIGYPRLTIAVRCP